MKIKGKKFILDIDYNVLEKIENHWFKIGLFRYADNATFLKGVDGAVDEDILDIVNEELPLQVKTGRAFTPTKMVGVLKVLLDYYQIENSSYRAYLLRDPAGIDTTTILDTDLVPSSMLQSVANKLDIVIPVEFITIYEETNIQNAKKFLPEEAIDDLVLVEEVATELYAILDKALSRTNINETFKLGSYYTLHMSNGVIMIIEAEKNIMEIRYENIVKVRTKELREETIDDSGEETE